MQFEDVIYALPRGLVCRAMDFQSEVSSSISTSNELIPSSRDTLFTTDKNRPPSKSSLYLLKLLTPIKSHQY